MADYVLGGDAAEIARLDGQAAALERATRRHLTTAGIAPGMRVLDLGTGLGHVAMLTADLVGPQGQVVGIDSGAAQLAVAESRRRAAHVENVRFVEGDVHTWRDGQAFDAMVGRLILFHMPDPVAVLRHHLDSLKWGGLCVALDFDIGASRTEPEVPLVSRLLDWVQRAFAAAGAHPAIGARLALHLADAGFADVQSQGLQEYFAPDDPRGPMLFAGVVRALAPQIARLGIATPEQIGVETLAHRVAAEVRAAGAVVLPPTLACAWGRKA
jgi:ubiquinone/menaquinone biosynthesis C-methylase UbiE